MIVDGRQLYHLLVFLMHSCPLDASGITLLNQLLIDQKVNNAMSLTNETYHEAIEGLVPECR